MPPSNGLTIAQVSPYSWEGHNEVNAYVAGAAAELKARGHRVVVAAPGGTREETRLTQRTIERTRSDGAPRVRCAAGLQAAESGGRSSDPR